MAELEDVTLDGRPLDSLRVTDLRAALEERGLPKSGQKSALMKRLKGALMLENLQKHSTPHTGFQPNSQMGEEMGQNSFIKQYLEKQQELLRQRLQKEAREAQETEEPSAESEDENVNPDIVPEPPDILSSVLKMPEVELGKHTPKKGHSVLEDPEESEEEFPKKRERRSSRVKQAKVSKPSVFTQPVQEQEPRRTSTRARKSAAREEVEEAGEEEEEEMEEEKEVAVEKDEEETPKRRRSSRTTVALQQKKSPKLKRSPSPPELLETVPKAKTLEGEETSEERVPPMLSLEGIHQQISEKQVSPVSEKTSSPRLTVKESPKSHRSPQKWRRQARERIEAGADAAVQQAPVSTSVIQQPAASEREDEKLEIIPQDSEMCEDTKSASMVTTPASTAKDAKVRSSLVLMKPPVRSKSEGTTVCTQSLQIVEKLSSRGVQAMSILEKQDIEPCSDVKESQSLLSSPELLKSTVKSKSLHEKSDASSLIVSGPNESDKPELSPACSPSFTKTRRLRVRTSSVHQDQPENVKTIQAVDLQEKAQAPVILNEPLDNEQESVLKISECEQTEVQPKEISDTKLAESVTIQKTEMTVKPEGIVDKPQLEDPLVSVLETDVKEITSTNIYPDNSMTGNVCSGPSEMEESSLGITSPHTEETGLIKETPEMTLETKGPSITEEPMEITENSTEVQDSANVASTAAIVPETIPDTQQSSYTQEETLLKPYTESQIVDESESEKVTKDCPVIEDETTEDTLVSPMPISPVKQEPITIDETPQVAVNIEETPNDVTAEDLRLVASQEETELLNETETTPTSPGISALSCSTEYSNTASEILQQSDKVHVQQTEEATVPNKISHESEISQQDSAMDLEAPEDNVADEDLPIDSISENLTSPLTPVMQDSTVCEPVTIPAAETEDVIAIPAAETEDVIAKSIEVIQEDVKVKESEDNGVDSEDVAIQPSEISIDIKQSDVEMAGENVIAQEDQELKKELISEDHEETPVKEHSDQILSEGPPEQNVEEPEIIQLPSPAQNEFDNKSDMQSTEDKNESSQTNEGEVHNISVPPPELKQPEVESHIDVAMAPNQISPETGNSESNDVTNVSEKTEPQKEDEPVKPANDASPLHHTTDELLPNDDQYREIEDTQEAVEVVKEASVVEFRRSRTSSSSSSSSTSSSSSSTSSHSSHSSTEKSSHSRRSSRSKSSSPERQDQKSQSSRSSSPHSDKEDQLCSERSETECPAFLSSEVLPLETSQSLPTTSPPPTQTPVRLQRNTFNQGHSPSHPGRGERRRPHATYDAEEQEQSKRMRLEPQSEDQDPKSPVPGEQEVEEEHSPGDNNVAPEREDTAMDTAESQTEGEVQETAPSQPQEDNCDTHEKKESTTPPRTFKRKISVISATKCTSQPSPASTTNSDSEGAHPARRRRWGASTATTQKKPSISISTESLKSLIPEIKEIKQEAVVDLHAEDARISEDESERNGDDDNSHDKGLKICRTVTQVVPAEVQENGQEEDEVLYQNQSEEAPVAVQEPIVPMEIEPPPPSEQEVMKPLPESPAQAEVRVTLGDTLLRRSISQQKSSVSITIDDPVRTAAQQPSPPRRKPSCIVHICNLVRPFTLGQLKELLSRTGTIVEESFWIDKIKSHCYVTYSTVEEAVSTRNSLHGVRWPQSNPKFLSVDFAEQDELDFHRGLLAERPPEPKPEEPPHQHSHSHTHAPPLRGEQREHERGVREQWAEREREMERRERTRSEREWDRDKIREGPRSRSRDRRRKEHAKSKEKKNEKKEKVQEEPPAKLLDDLFHKTKAAPCIYWLPLTDDQIVKKVADRAERAKEREKRRKEQEEEERKERAKEREKEAERNRERVREADREKRREHSREHPRERERRDPKRHSRSRSRSTPVRDRGGRR